MNAHAICGPSFISTGKLQAVAAICTIGTVKSNGGKVDSGTGELPKLRQADSDRFSVVRFREAASCCMCGAEVCTLGREAGTNSHFRPPYDGLTGNCMPVNSTHADYDATA